MPIDSNTSLKSGESQYVLVLIVENEPGVLARVVGLISARGYNIESLTVSAVSEDHAVSRVNLVTQGDPMIIEQMKAQILRLVPVRSVYDLALSKHHIERESLLIKIVAEGAERREALRIANVFRARVVDTTLTSFIFLITGSSEKLESFILLMKDLGKTEVARSGIIAMARGDQIIE